MSNLALIQPLRVDFDTQQNRDWLDGLPGIARPVPGGAAAGAGNVGSGSLIVASVDAGAAMAGVQIVAVAAISGGQTALTVTDLDGQVTGRGVVGLPVYAGGVTFTLSQVPGQPALAVGDTFAVATLPQAIDITGLRFDLDARNAVGSKTIALAASSADTVPTIVNGGAAGTVALRVPRATMLRCPPGDYPYDITAADPDTGLTVTAFYGLIHHTAVASQLSA